MRPRGEIWDGEWRGVEPASHEFDYAKIIISFKLERLFKLGYTLTRTKVDYLINSASTQAWDGMQIKAVLLF